MATILLVNDEKILRTLLAVALKRRHHSVLEAANGRRAVTAAQRHRDSIDLLVCELSLPDMSGLEVAEKVRGGNAGLSVLFLSRTPTPARLEQRARASGHTVLGAPFDVSTLLAEVSRILGLAEGRKPPARSVTATERRRSAANGRH